MSLMAGPPAEFHFATWRPRRERALPSFLVSLAVHAGVVTAIWTINPRASYREFQAPTITQIMAEENRQITWYAPKTEMPAVSPVEEPDPRAVAETPRYQAPQPIQATAPDAASDKQVIVSDAPEIQFQQDQELPNMLSWQAPKVERPRFQLTAPRLQAPPQPQKIEQPEPPPKVEPVANAGLDVSRFQQIARLRYQARNPGQAPPGEKPVEPDSAPQIAAAPTAPKVDPAQFQELSRLRFQREQQRRQAPSQRAVEAEEAPKIEAQTGPGVDASRFSELSRLRYQQQEQQRQAPQRRTLSAEDAPALKDAPGQPGLDASQFQQLARLRYQAGDRGQAQPEPSRQALGAVAEGPAPRIGGGPSGAAGVDAASLQELPRLRYQGASQGAPAGPAPSARALGDVAGAATPSVAAGEPAGGPALTEIAKLDLPGAPPPSLGAPGGEQTGGTGGPVNMVVAGVNPAGRAPRELPRGSRSGAFSAGPNATPDGGRTASSGTTAAGLRAPNLTIQGPPSGATAPPDAADRLRSLTRSGGFERLQPGEAPKVQSTPGKPPINPEMPFVGRPVYTLAINMPNVTSYRGDWVIQFAEALAEDERKKETEEERAARLSKKDGSLTPPYPIIKVDPKYSPDAVREQVEGVVVLYCMIRETGEMTNLQLVEGLDPRLDASAREAFAKWKFEPARKKGLPIAVETLIRIPFRLNPDVKIRY